MLMADTGVKYSQPPSAPTANISMQNTAAAYRQILLGGTLPLEMRRERSSSVRLFRSSGV